MADMISLVPFLIVLVPFAIFICIVSIYCSFLCARLLAQKTIATVSSSPAPVAELVQVQPVIESV